jgi:hypothetical protein
VDWELNATPVDVADIGKLAPSEVLYEFDGPRIFSAQSPLGDLLCFLVDDDGAELRFIAAPTNPDILAKLKDGIRSVRDALDQPWVWFVDLGYDGQPRAAWRGTLSDIPADVLPEKGVMLWPHLEPIFAVRAIGDGLSEGQVPMSVIRQVIEGATTALKKVSNVVFDDAKRAGRKAKTIRQFYDLPTLGFAYNSFEAAFRLPDGQQAPLTGMVDEVGPALHAISQKLKQALDWAIEIQPDGVGDVLQIELLEALEKLVPPQSGVVKSIEVRGQLFPNDAAPYRLTRDASTRVRRALREARASQETITTVSGLVREFDKDHFSFTLRETDDGKDHVCRFQPESYDELYEVFDSDDRITISGRENLKTNEIDVSLVSRE